MTSHHDLLADRVRRRRLELGLGLEPAARSAGMSKDTWKKVERGLPVRDTSYAHVERALGWAAGSCDLVLAGEDALEVRPAESAPGVVLAALPERDLEADIVRALQSAAIAVTDLPASLIREMNARVVEDLRARGVL